MESSIRKLLIQSALELAKEKRISDERGRAAIIQHYEGQLESSASKDGAPLGSSNQTPKFAYTTNAENLSTPDEMEIEPTSSKEIVVRAKHTEPRKADKAREALVDGIISCSPNNEDDEDVASCMDTQEKPLAFEDLTEDQLGTLKSEVLAKNVATVDVVKPNAKKGVTLVRAKQDIKAGGYVSFLKGKLLTKEEFEKPVRVQVQWRRILLGEGFKFYCIDPKHYWKWVGNRIPIDAKYANCGLAEIEMDSEENLKYCIFAVMDIAKGDPVVWSP